MGAAEVHAGRGLQRKVVKNLRDGQCSPAELDGALLIPHEMKAVGRERQGSTEASLVSELLGQRVGFAEMLERPPHLAQRGQGVAELESKVYRSLLGLAALGQVLHGRQGVLEKRRRLAIGRACERLGAGPLQI